MSTQPLAVYRQDFGASIGGYLVIAVFLFIWAGLMVGVFGSVALAALAVDADPVLVGAVAGLVVAGLVLVGGYSRVNSVRYEIYDDHVRKTYGAITENVEELAVTDIDSVEYRESLFDGLVGTGTVEIEPKGSDDAFYIKHVGEAKEIYERFSEVA